MPETALAVRVEQSPVARMLDDRAGELIDLLPSRAAVERFKRVTLQAIIRNPRLLTATPESVVSAVMEAAAVGLEPTGAIGGAHLVPYKQKDGTTKAQLIYDYRGVVDLVTRPYPDGRPSEVTAVDARVVKEGDDFRYQLGSDARVEHTPSLDANRSAKPTTHVYMVARLRDGTVKVDVEDRAGIERIRKRSRAKDDGPWVTDWDEMGKKTIVKRGSKLLPIRPEVRGFLAREDDVDPEPTPALTASAAPRTQQLAARIRGAERLSTTESSPVPPVADAPPAAAGETDHVLPAASPPAAGGTPPDIEEGQVREAPTGLCGDAEPYGDGGTCGLPAGHLERPGAMRIHRQLDGAGKVLASWPAK